MLALALLLGSQVVFVSGCRVELFQHDHFRGYKKTYYPGSYWSVWRNDDVSSLKVWGSGCKAVTYEHGGFRGRAVTLTQGSWNLSRLRSRGFQNDRMSSLKVLNGQQTGGSGSQQEHPGAECWSSQGCIKEGAESCDWCGGSDWYCCSGTKSYASDDKCGMATKYSTASNHRCAKVEADANYQYSGCSNAGCTVNIKLEKSSPLDLWPNDYSSTNEYVDIYVDGAFKRRCDPGIDIGSSWYNCGTYGPGNISVRSTRAVNCCKKDGKQVYIRTQKPPAEPVKPEIVWERKEALELTNNVYLDVAASDLGTWGKGDFTFEVTWKGRANRVLTPDGGSGYLFLRQSQTWPYHGPTAEVYQTGAIDFQLRKDDQLECPSGTLANPTGLRARNLRFIREGNKLKVMVDGVEKCSKTLTKAVAVEHFQNANLRVGGYSRPTMANLDITLLDIKFWKGVPEDFKATPAPERPKNACRQSDCSGEGWTLKQTLIDSPELALCPEIGCPKNTDFCCTNCPWKEGHAGKGKNVIQCFDGSYCNAATDGSACCYVRNGERARCQEDAPIMCKKNCGFETGCCRTACGDDGERECPAMDNSPDGEVGPLPVEYADSDEFLLGSVGGVCPFMSQPIASKEDCAKAQAVLKTKAGVTEFADYPVVDAVNGPAGCSVAKGVIQFVDKARGYGTGKGYLRPMCRKENWKDTFSSCDQKGCSVFFVQEQSSPIYVWPTDFDAANEYVDIYVDSRHKGKCNPGVDNGSTWFNCGNYGPGNVKLKLSQHVDENPKDGHLLYAYRNVKVVKSKEECPKMVLVGGGEKHQGLYKMVNGLIQRNLPVYRLETENGDGPYLFAYHHDWPNVYTKEWRIGADYNKPDREIMLKKNNVYRIGCPNAAEKFSELIDGKWKESRMTVTPHDGSPVTAPTSIPTSVPTATPTATPTEAEFVDPSIAGVNADCMTEAAAATEGAAKRHHFEEGCKLASTVSSETQCLESCAAFTGAPVGCCQCNPMCHQCGCDYCTRYCKKYAPTAEGVIVLDGGNGSFAESTCVSPSAKKLQGVSIAAQCCEGNTCRRYVGTNDDAGCIVGLGGGTIHETDFFTAKSLCEARGLSLCTENCSREGCQYNQHPVWTSRRCDLSGTYTKYDGACRDANGGHGTNTLHRGKSKEWCERMCSQDVRCNGYEITDSKGNCEIHVGTIAYGNGASGTTCYKKDQKGAGSEKAPGVDEKGRITSGTCKSHGMKNAENMDKCKDMIAKVEGTSLILWAIEPVAFLKPGQVPPCGNAQRMGSNVRPTGCFMTVDNGRNRYYFNGKTPDGKTPDDTNCGSCSPTYPCYCQA